MSGLSVFSTLHYYESPVIFFPSLMLLQDLERTGAVRTVGARGRNATVDSGGPGCGCWRTSEGPQQRNSRAGQSQSTKVVCK